MCVDIYNDFKHFVFCNGDCQFALEQSSFFSLLIHCNCLVFFPQLWPVRLVQHNHVAKSRWESHIFNMVHIEILKWITCVCVYVLICAVMLTRTSPTYRRNEPCLPSWIQPSIPYEHCISCFSCQPCIPSKHSFSGTFCTFSRTLSPASKSSIPTSPIPSCYEPCNVTKWTSRCDAVRSSPTTSVPPWSTWVSTYPSSRCLSTRIPTFTKMGSPQRVLPRRCKHCIWSSGWRVDNNGDGSCDTQSQQEDEEEDEESTQMAQAWLLLQGGTGLKDYFTCT